MPMLQRDIVHKLYDILADVLGGSLMNDGNGGLRRLIRDDIKLDSKLIDDLRADDIDLQEITVHVEKGFDLVVDDWDAQYWYRVTDIVDYLYARLNDYPLPEHP
ncbi:MULTISPECIES: hypothetical protein [unclassified Streptomyces]|uniref:hypothetical protein n=1 Tax=unclassified Streptomyces TaxID=2593676 RepID=UPI0033962897